MSILCPKITKPQELSLTFEVFCFSIFFMKVSPTQPFQMVYSLFQHEYLGYLLGAFVVQINSKNELTLLHQIVSSKNIKDFSSRLDSTDFELIKLIEAAQQETILKKFNPKKWPATDFFQKVYDPQKGDKLLQETITGYLENIKTVILEKIPHKPLFVMGNDGNPAWLPLQIMPDKVRVFFHFKRNDTETHYFPILKYNTERLQIRHCEAFLFCDEPACLVIDNKLYYFGRNVDGKKLRPFFKKNHIVIPKNVEAQYYQRFVAPLVAAYDVFAEGFEIRYETSTAKPILTLSENSTAQTGTLFEDLTPTLPDELQPADQPNVVLDLAFQYGTFLFRFDNFAAGANVSIEKQGNDYVFHKVRRDLKLEKERVLFLNQTGLGLQYGRGVLSKAAAFAWLQANYQKLEDMGFEIQQNTTDTKRYFLGYSSIDISIEEGRDWFDIYAKVRFGDYEIAFIDLKNLILARKKEFKLPNGEVAVIPEVWLTKYAELFAFIEQDDQKLLLRKHHLALVQELSDESLAKTVMNRKLEKLRQFAEIDPQPLPKGFRGTLRPYQKAGYDWLYFLNQYRFGGCLADDMGLGKTVTTLAMLQAQKEAAAAEPSLLVMPTSLLYNWEMEARKFAPQLRVLVYAGSQRQKDPQQFGRYDLVLTSYGTARMDADLLKNYRFNYLILDESQAIKNPSSHISQAIRQFNAAHRLILTGTPLENTTMDLWSQMTFINPGLLGSQSFFRTHFQVPIEKHNDEQQTQKLYALIKPFLLRRHKSQVALDLPPKVENIHYCTMTETQEQQYEEAKSYYRNLILQQIEDNGMGKTQLMVLQGLTKLRQLANHPRMIDPAYEGDSGKFKQVIHQLETALSTKHKVLIFSQYVKHLSIVRQHLDTHGVVYAYLDGATLNRQAQVDTFQQDSNVQVFLISLKAGGLGLNLTAAEYVFLLDPWWNPAIEAQAVDRAHRIGQQKTVFTYKFITKNTVEEKILDLQRSKQRLFNDLITTEESFVKSLTKADIMSLLE